MVIGCLGNRLFCGCYGTSAARTDVGTDGCRSVPTARAEYRDVQSWDQSRTFRASAITWRSKGDRAPIDWQTGKTMAKLGCRLTNAEYNTTAGLTQQLTQAFEGTK